MFKWFKKVPTSDDSPSDCESSSEPKSKLIIAVMGPEGLPITFNDLPKPTLARWTLRAKAKVIFAMKGGLITFKEACDRYGVTREELLYWQKDVEKYFTPEEISRRKEERLAAIQNHKKPRAHCFRLNNEQLELVRDLRIEGQSAQKISENTGLNRNTIIVAIYRMGLS